MSIENVFSAGKLGLSRFRRNVLTILCGIGIGLGQSPFDLPWLMFLAMPVLFLVLSSTKSRWQGFRVGWLTGTAYFAVTLSWIVEPFLVDVPRHGWMAPFALIFMAGGLALFWGAAFAGAQSFSSKYSRLFALVAFWSFVEWLRSWVFTGFPWAMLSYAWVETPIIQSVALFGPFALTLLTLLFCLSPGLGKRFILVPVLGLGCAWWAGDARLNQPQTPRDPPVFLRLLQPNAAQHLKWQPKMMPVFYNRAIHLTSLPSDRPLDAVIWPETSAPFVLEDRPDLIADMAKAAGVPVVFGVRRVDTQGNWYNSMAIADADGALLTTYDKSHLVPFGEYMPLQGVIAQLGISGLADATGGGFTSGDALRVISAAGLPSFLPLICYEAVFPTEINRVEARAEWLLHITNDAWFGQWTGPYQHLAQTRIRAIEQGLPMARAANTGVSAMIDAYGQVTASLPHGLPGKLDAELPPALAETFYARWGEAVFFAFLALCLISASFPHRAGKVKMPPAGIF